MTDLPLFEIASVLVRFDHVARRTSPLHQYRTRVREVFRRIRSVYGRGRGVGRGLGVGLTRGVGVGLIVEVGVAVAVAVGVAVGVPDGQTSNPLTVTV
jgi:hypothetical protein